MIIVVGGIKGGSGKTTLATNLGVIRSAEGHDVLLIDADDQETSTDFTIIRNERRPDGAGYTSIKLTGAAVRTETQCLANKYEDIIIDTGGRDTTSQRAALTVADFLLVPFVPRSFDVWTLEKVSSLVNEMQAANPDLQAYTFINRADPRGQGHHLPRFVEISDRHREPRAGRDVAARQVASGGLVRCDLQARHRGHRAVPAVRLHPPIGHRPGDPGLDPAGAG